MKERQFQSMFGKFIAQNPPAVTTVFELKICKGPSIRFDSVQEHQQLALRNAQGGGVYHRITDQPWMKDRPFSFTKPKPFDCLFIRDAEAYVVVLFYKPRRKKDAVFIGIEDWIYESTIAGRKSLTEARAREISSKIELIV